MDMDVCVHSPGSIHCYDYVAEEGSSPCGGVAATMYTHTCCVHFGVFNTSRFLNFIIEVRANSSSNNYVMLINKLHFF